MRADNGHDQRVGAMSAFHSWVTTAQREWRRNESAANPDAVFKVHACVGRGGGDEG